MKPEEYAWRQLQTHAAAQLRRGFADRVLRAARGPQDETWRQLQAHAGAQLRPGFAARVLRAARQIPGVPSLRDQFAFSAATVALCVLTVVFIHSRSVRLEDERNLAGWEQLADEVQDLVHYR
ncbi:MAG: hypothetical protein HY736_22090 [Verrucomicrobia bacterium]|nr:hypothetical protein [Verrucomicrobiota bacterium]